MLARRRFDVADRPLHRAQRFLIESKRERQVEEELGVGRSGDTGEERGVDRQQQISANGLEVLEQAVVHEQPAAVAEGMAVRLLDGASHRRANVSQEERRLDVVRELAQVGVVPSRGHASVAGGVGRGLRPRTSRSRIRRRWWSRHPSGSAGSRRSARARSGRAARQSPAALRRRRSSGTSAILHPRRGPRGPDACSARAPAARCSRRDATAARRCRASRSPRPLRLARRQGRRSRRPRAPRPGSRGAPRRAPRNERAELPRGRRPQRGPPAPCRPLAPSRDRAGAGPRRSRRNWGRAPPSRPGPAPRRSRPASSCRGTARPHCARRRRRDRSRRRRSASAASARTRAQPNAQR